MMVPRLTARVLLSALLLIFAAGLPAGVSDWPPVPPEELALKDSPTHPGSHALILYREVFTDDVKSSTTYHTRIKVLTEEGRKYADVEIPYAPDFYRIHELQARTVRPDGTSVEFSRQVFEKTVVKGKGLKFLAKSFTLPDVQVGSIIEYKFRVQMEGYLIPETRWLIRDELPIRRLILTRRRYGGMALRWISVRLPSNQEPRMTPDGLIVLQMENVAPLPEEEYMPPRDELNMRVDFFYLRKLESTEKFWKDIGKFWFESAEEFIGKHDEIAREAATVAGTGEPPETRLRKLYARVQQIRNLSFERFRTEKEIKQEKLKQNNNVKDVLKNGYGYAWGINCLFVALARAAGFDSQVAYLAPRHQYFFDADFLDTSQLSGYVAVVRQGSTTWFLDPSTRFAPFGLLPWTVTGVRGLLLNKNGGEFVDSPEPLSNQAIVERVAHLQLLEDGTLQGKLEVSFKGLQALEQRLDIYREDETGKRKTIKDVMKKWFPAGATLEITNAPNWESSEEPLSFECTLTLPNFAAPTGRRVLLPAGVFQANQRHPFQNATRVHPIYFGHPFQEVDDVSIELPPGLDVESLPPSRSEEANWAVFKTSRSREGNLIRLQRRFTVNRYQFPANQYPALRTLYDVVYAADEERLVLQTNSAAR